jgi:hypothetical protein
LSAIEPLDLVYERPESGTILEKTARIEGVDLRAQVLQSDVSCWEVQQRCELGGHGEALVFHMGDMTGHMFSGLQTGQQGIEGWCRQAALDFLVQR